MHGRPAGDAGELFVAQFVDAGSGQHPVDARGDVGVDLGGIGIGSQRRPCGSPWLDIPLDDDVAVLGEGGHG
ncbi:hypothetical protein D9M73_270270 [compost metagenome]